ncbi:ABC transporter ATP-binding protein [Oscillatoria amoena NRMC-F 0135]|nr:ABC transporter ATP-binding protein [Oscillatoria amoena NRMC-F 0135]
MNSHLNEMLMGTRLIRTTNSQQRENDRFYEINKEFSTLLAESAKAGAALTPITETLGVVGGMAIVASAAVFLVNPGYMKGDMLLGFAFVLLRLLPAVNMVYGLYGQTISLAGGIEQSERWLKVDQFPRRPFGKVAFTGFNRGLRLQNLTFDYPNGHRALKNVSFEIKYGEVTALVGGSGSGKTTIASLLLRLRQPTEGCILIDGQDYWDFTPESWHRNVAIVEQDAFLFSGTLYENVCYGLSGVSEDEVKLAIRRAHLEHVVNNMPDGLQTLIGERGVMLSGGQRQRLSIARALVRNPKLLILDEATSALDSISESQVQAALDEAAEGRSVLVIAHRFSTVRRAHKIVVMENGQVAEQGSWQELENRDGAFRRLLSASQKALI